MKKPFNAACRGLYPTRTDLENQLHRVRHFLLKSLGHSQNLNDLRVKSTFRSVHKIMF